MISEAEERKEEARARKKGGGRPGHGSWASRGVFLPETSTNEVRNCLQLFVATGRGSAAHDRARERGARVWRPTGADGEIRPEVRSAAAPWRGASRSARPCWPWVPPQRLQQAQDDRRQLRERP